MIQNKRLRFRVIIKKYSVETESTKPSYFISDRTLLRSNEELPSLYISKKRTKHGYWLVGLRNGTQYGLKRGAKDARGYVTLREHDYGKPEFTQTLYSRSSLKPYVQALNKKQAWSFDDFMVDFNGYRKALSGYYEDNFSVLGKIVFFLLSLTLYSKRSLNLYVKALTEK